MHAHTFGLTCPELCELEGGDVLLPPEVGGQFGERGEEVVEVHEEVHRGVQLKNQS